MWFCGYCGQGGVPDKHKCKAKDIKAYKRNNMPTQKKAMHTPTPWEQFGSEIAKTGPKHGKIIAKMAHGFMTCAPDLKIGDEDWDLQMANAAFIVRAVNNHDRLVDLLKRNLVRMKLINTNCVHDALRDCPNHALMEETEQALKQAGE